MALPESPNLLVTESSPLVLAQAIVASPTADDLAETPEVQFTPAIQALATQLNHSPVKIYEWVRNNIEFVPTYGSIQGADMCLQTMQCNSLDTNALLASLLRVSNIPVHFVYGTIEVPIATIMNWTGGFTDPKAAVTMLASGGIPVKTYTSGGVITKVQMEHAWVETYTPYGNYRGSGTDDSLKTWIPMDGSFKQYTYTNGFDITATVPFDSNAYMSQIQSQNPVHYYQSQIRSYLDANLPNTSIVDVKGYREIAQETYHFLPATLPYITIAQLGKFSAVPTAMAATVTFTLTDATTDAAVSYRASTPELAGKRITVSYIPATANDEALIAAHGGYLYDVPAYMLQLKPVLRIEGVIKLTGEMASMGSDETLSIQFNQSNGMNEAIQKKLITGTFYAVGLDLQGVNENVLGKRNASLTANVLSESAGTLGNDDLIGEFLFIRAINYSLANDKIYKAGAKLFNVVTTRTISEAITSFPLAVTTVFSVPKSVKPAGAEMDVAMDRIIAIAKDGNTTKEKAFMEISGLVSSYHEHDIWEKIDQFASVSAVKAIQSAATSSIPVHTINAANISQLLPTIQVAAEVKQDVQNAVNAGKEVIIPETNVQIEDWLGVGYIVRDPTTGSGTYMISGGLNGALTVAVVIGIVIAGFIAGPLVFIIVALFLIMGNTIAEAAQLNEGERIARTANQLAIDGDPDAIDCSTFIRKVYWEGAGICLDDSANCPQPHNPNNLAAKKGVQTYYYDANNKLRYYNGIKVFFDLATEMKGIKTTNDAVFVGDIVFFDNTTGLGHPLSHGGIVVSAPDANGMVYYVDVTNQEVNKQKMNITNKSQPTQNDPLGNFCPPGQGTPCLSGNLFRAYGTIRNK